ncbi:MAG TPA: hypothetical protein VEU54_02335 [Steroidobacteraceae bacterium]|jgi:hypothetical protein|nr:hypothetical protein [Steroidobacteraceae bacterium]
MKTSNHTHTLIRSLALIGGSLLAYSSVADAAAPADEGPQALASALLSPPVRSVAVDAGSAARAEARRPAADAVQLAQRFLTGATDVPADGAPGRLRLAERRHDADAHELIRRTILGHGA